MSYGLLWIQMKEQSSLCENIQGLWKILLDTETKLKKLILLACKIYLFKNKTKT